jgi:predicted transcriptional regulator
MAEQHDQLNHPVPITEEEDEATLAAIDRGIKDIEEGRVFSLAEARQRIQQWLSKSSSRNNR